MSGIQARALMEASVRRELFGPPEDEDPRGKPLDCSTGVLHFQQREDSYGIFHDKETNEEVLTQSDPLRRYGVGVLYNGASIVASVPLADNQDSPEDIDVSWVPGLGQQVEDPKSVPDEVLVSAHFDDSASDDFDLTDANTFKPSAMAISFRCRVQACGGLGIRVMGAYYDRIAAHIPGFSKPRDWWVRRPIDLVGSVDATSLVGSTKGLITVHTETTTSLAPRLAPVTQVFVRPVPGEDDPLLRLVTVVLKNASPGAGSASALFQVRFSVVAKPGLSIEPYPEIERPNRDEEEESIDLLYRNQLTFAIGHGCAATWDGVAGADITCVSADPLPSYEVPSLTPDIFTTRADGVRVPVSVSMMALANGEDEGRKQVETVMSMYESWITARSAEICELPERHQVAARRHMDLCGQALTRMREGWSLVTTDATAGLAFRLANEAMLYQQIRSRLPLRQAIRHKDGTVSHEGNQPSIAPEPGSNNWRAFQIAFLLASLPELVNPRQRNRAVVDLIFFPTGGGKTEAYLGAAAISLLARRLRDPADSGTDTLMRYTLRLLTAQQFVRAAALVCVLEDLRSQDPGRLGDAPFGIGIWLGSSSTPNTWKAAIDALHKMQRDRQAQNKFLLLRCPWCGAEMGPKPRSSGGVDVVGYHQRGQKVVLCCPDRGCRYSRVLPVHVVDDDIYETRPSVIIGTVDKFAMMAWLPLARRIFGIADDGQRAVSPPNLIIQDELHLISGPLGSMVGLYEPIIDDLCTDRRTTIPVPPKIIASTATVRRYADQIEALFGRRASDVALFPPHGLEEGHSFFAEPETLDDGSLAPGRRYVGIFSASLGSTQTVQVRLTAATLQAGAAIPEADRDGYWTNLNFLNSLRELGNTVSLLQSDVPDYLTGLGRRDQIDPRWPRNTMELTSRRRSDEIPKAIEQLQVTCGRARCVDICLASNIIEVGVDIERLALMTIVGQPKTTAQYIQVSGRVGRRPSVAPGLVITVYGAAKPRDRSHFERFRTYHQRLYAQVEPTSVTPFATPVLRRALHAAIVAHIRQTSPVDAEPYPFPQPQWDVAAQLIHARAAMHDPGAIPNLESETRIRSRQWGRWDRTQWSANAYDGGPSQGLMRFAGTLPALTTMIWDVPTSMRNVDAECSLEISTAYNREDANTEGVPNVSG